MNNNEITEKTSKMEKVSNAHLLDEGMQFNNPKRNERMKQTSEAAKNPTQKPIAKETMQSNQNVIHENYQMSNNVVPSTEENYEYFDNMNAVNKVKEEKDTILGMPKPLFIGIVVLGVAVGGYFLYKKFGTKALEAAPVV